MVYGRVSPKRLASKAQYQGMAPALVGNDQQKKKTRVQYLIHASVTRVSRKKRVLQTIEALQLLNIIFKRSEESYADEL